MNYNLKNHNPLITYNLSTMNYELPSYFCPQRYPLGACLRVMTVFTPS